MPFEFDVVAWVIEQAEKIQKGMEDEGYTDVSVKFKDWEGMGTAIFDVIYRETT